MVGQLTAKGYEQERALGAIFNKAYVGNFLQSKLTRSEVWLPLQSSSSTDVQL
jgi:hypothetical protein